MLGQYTLLPLLKGWEYRARSYTRTVQRGQTLEVAREAELGWLCAIVLQSNDCYGGVLVDSQGADLEIRRIELIVEAGRQAGAFMHDPAGWVQRYYRPNPNSTAGFYYAAISLGFHGSIYPYVPTTIVNLTLTEESTQAAATVTAGIQAVAITDPRLFMRSLRSVLGMPVILPIDPALLVPGREELTLKGPQEKEA